MQTQAACCDAAWLALRGRGLDVHTSAVVMEYCLEQCLPDLWLHVALGGSALAPPGVRAWMRAPDRCWASWLVRPADEDMQHEVLTLASRLLSMDEFIRVYGHMESLLSDPSDRAFS